jgi:hypothetical protein
VDMWRGGQNIMRLVQVGLRAASGDKMVGLHSHTV